MTTGSRWGLPTKTGSIPDYLKRNARWCVYQAVPRKEGKVDKIPLSPVNGYRISTAAPDHWGTFEQAEKALETNPKANGLGILVENNGLVCVDLDNCVMAGGDYSARVKGIVDSLNSYTEFSPSGKGLRILIAGNQPPSDVLNSDAGVEIYSGHAPRFVTITGLTLKGKDKIRKTSGPEIHQLYEQYKTVKSVTEDLDMPAPEGVDLTRYGWSTDQLKHYEFFDPSIDRSLEVQKLARQLYGLGLNDAQVLGTLWSLPAVYDTAMSHRRQDEDKALVYLWKHHCLHARESSLREQFPDLDSVQETETFTNDEQPKKVNKLQPVSVAGWEGTKAPDRQWLVKDWIPLGEVTALYGDGGVGKSLLAMDLQTCIVKGISWFGHEVMQGQVLGMYCEDKPHELQRRQESINGKYMLKHKDLADSHLISRVGQNNLLITFDGHDQASPTELWHNLNELLANGHYKLLIVDTAADTFGGNENVRAQVRQFIQACLGYFAVRYNIAVVLLAHPSVTGMATGTGGSTAWSNSVRSRLFFARDEDNPEIRVLKRMKSNYAAAGDEAEQIRVVWRDGAWVDVTTGGDFLEEKEAEAVRMFAELLRECNARGENVSASLKGNYAPRIFVNMAHARGIKGFNLGRFEMAMETLFSRGLIANELIDSGRSRRLVWAKNDEN